MSHSVYTEEPPSPADSSLATSIFDSSAPSHSVSDSDKRAAQIAKWRFSTLAANVDTKDQYGASSTPIYQTATFKGVEGQYDYTRSGNPTRGGLGECGMGSGWCVRGVSRIGHWWIYRGP